jgi:Uncharacterized conserved protein
MAIKTISLELDAYEKLKRAKRGNESFSSVVRRAHFDAEPSTGRHLLEETAALYRAKKGVSKKTLDYWEGATTDDAKSPRISKSAWEV